MIVFGNGFAFGQSVPSDAAQPSSDADASGHRGRTESGTRNRQLTTAAATADSPEGEATTTPQTYEQKKVAALLAATYDRTPAGILKAWKDSQIETQEPEGSETEDQSNGTPATVNSLFKDFLVLEIKQPADLKIGQPIQLLLDDDLIGTASVLEINGTEITTQTAN